MRSFIGCKITLRIPYRLRQSGWDLRLLNPQSTYPFPAKLAIQIAAQLSGESILVKISSPLHRQNISKKDWQKSFAAQ